MKQVIYSFVVLLSAVCYMIPLFVIAGAIVLHVKTGQQWGYWVAVVLSVLAIALNNPIRDLRV